MLKLCAAQTWVWGEAELDPPGAKPVKNTQEKLPFSLCGIKPDFAVHIISVQAAMLLINKCGY